MHTRTSYLIAFMRRVLQAQLDVRDRYRAFTLNKTGQNCLTSENSPRLLQFLIKVP